MYSVSQKNSPSQDFLIFVPKWLEIFSPKFTCLQWRTEEGLRGLEPLPLAYDLRNKRVRMRQKCGIFNKKYEKNFGEGPSPDLSPMGTGIHPPQAPPPRRLRHLDPSHSKILGTPLHAYYTFLSKLDYKFLFNYLQLWRSYAILSATTVMLKMSTIGRSARWVVEFNMTYLRHSWR